MRLKCKLPGVLALSVAGTVALGGVFGATSAMAEKATKHCAGTGIEGQGSSLQKIAQENVWIPAFEKVGGVCPGVTVKYLTSSSGTGQNEWNANGGAKTPAGSGDSFIGSDEPLTLTQMENIGTAAGGKLTQTIVIPVAQAAVAVIVNPPSGCTITRIGNADLQKVWNGTITKWEGILTASGSCSGAITRVVRKDKSGTTFVFKEYLENAALGVVTCNGSWKTLAQPANNQVWPENGLGTCAGLSALKEATNTGGGGEAEEVRATSGSIGYANLGDARALFTDEEGNKYHWLEVQNDGTETEEEAGEERTFAYPGVGTEPSLTVGKANCAETNYGATLPGVETNDDWSAISGAHVEAENYPICTLTYDVALASYEKAGFVKATEVGQTTSDYLKYVVKETTGQSEVGTNHDYDALPKNVNTVAEGLAKLVAES
jgi:ABC-type phosphate transport system substrate-binding protein